MLVILEDYKLLGLGFQNITSLNVLKDLFDSLDFFNSVKY